MISAWGNPQARLEVVPLAGHQVMQEQPHVVNDLVSAFVEEARQWHATASEAVAATAAAAAAAAEAERRTARRVVTLDDASNIDAAYVRACALAWACALLQGIAHAFGG